MLAAKHLNADVYTTYIDRKNVDINLNGINISELGLSFKRAKLLTFTEIALKFLNFKPDNYDMFLFTDYHAISAAKFCHPNIWICNSPIRILYDLHDLVYKRLSLAQKPIFDLWCRIYKQFHQKWVRDIDKTVAISQNVAKRISKYYKIKPNVIYPPVETEKFKFKSYEDFYLAPGRLMREKRIDLIIDAFKDLPDKNLVIVGDGPERSTLMKRASGSGNIQFLGTVSFDSLVNLYSRCTATIYMPFNEDFGLVPVESMASGKPCIAVNEGGCREAIINKRTGFLIKPTRDELRKYVNILTPENANEMKNECIKRSKMFDVEVFVKTIKKEMRSIA